MIQNYPPKFKHPKDGRCHQSQIYDELHEENQGNSQGLVSFSGLFAQLLVLELTISAMHQSWVNFSSTPDKIC